MKNELANKIVSCLTDDLRKPEYRGHENPLHGHCYVASESYHHLAGGKEAGLTAMRIKHEGTMHWWVRELLHEATNGKLYRHHDLTAGQFSTPVPYAQGIATGFLTKQPSKRARILMGRVQEVLA